MISGIQREVKKIRICSNLFFMDFFGCFCLGIILVNIIASEYLSEMGMFGDYFLMQFKSVELNTQSLFFYVFEKRMLFLIFLFVVGFTSIGCICSYICIGWFGLCSGLLLSLAAKEQGVIGMFICFLGVMPQFIIYVPFGYLFLKKMYRISSQLHFQNTAGMLERGYKRQIILSYFLVFLLTVVLYFIGVLLESYVNPVILKKVLSWL